MADLDAADWRGYQETIVIPNDDPDRPFGAYAKQARRRRKTAAASTCPIRAQPAR
jgi:hypothetical protein